MTEKNSTPLVSVIVPVYNAAEYLRQTLDCIRNQSLREIEIILVEDGSTDSTPAILKEYEDKDSRFILLQQEHEYAGAARNKGMAIARGKYFSFLDADDIFDPTMLEKMVTRAEAEQAEIVVCRSDTFREGKDSTPLKWQIRDRYLKHVNRQRFSLKKELPHAVMQAFIGWAWDKLFRADFVRKNAFMFGSTRHGNDGPFVFPALAAADSISIIDESLVKYRQSSGQISNTSNLSRNPDACCTSAALIYDGLCRLGVCEEVMNSFYLWFANYIGWNYSQYSYESKKKLKSYIRQHCNEIEYYIKPKTLIHDAAFKLVYESAKNNIDSYNNMLKPSISVILPIYNAGPYLREALDSLLDQTFSDFEAICVNDGSTDTSLEILKEYASKDSRIRILDGPNGGYGKAMNRGIDAATGEYMAILEPDDHLPKDAYEILYSTAEQHGTDISKGLVLRYSGDGDARVFKKPNVIPSEFLDKVTTPRVSTDIFRYNMNTWTCLYRLDFLNKYHIRHAETPGASYQDNSFYLLSFGHAERLVCTPRVVYHYREDNQNSSTNTADNKIYAHKGVYEFVRTQLEDCPQIWKQMQGVFMLKRFFSHKFIFERISSAAKEAYIEGFRSELQTYKGLDCSLLTDEMKWALQMILQTPDEYLRCNGKKPVDAPVERHENIPQTVEKSKRSRWLMYSPHKTELRIFGVPVWSKNTKGGRVVYRLFGIRYRHSKIK